MTVREIIQAGLTMQETTQKEFAENLGYKAQGCISKPLSRNDGMGMKVETLIKWVEELDGQLVVQFDNTEFVLDGE